MAQDLLQARLTGELGPINQALDQAIQEMPPPSQPVAKHIIGAGGKRLRPFLTVLCARLLGCETPDVYRAAASMELLHAATLLHDDILDEAESRRAKPAAHTIFGEKAAILAGDAMLAKGNDLVAGFGNPRLCACYSQATMRTAAGEILEMSSLARPDLAHETYLEIARGKTACLIAQACALGAHFARAGFGEAEACAEFGENLGIAFQLVDDALDFAPESQTGKPRGGDLREGKLTPPLRIYRESLDEMTREEFDRGFSNSSFTREQLEDIADAVAPYARQSLAIADEFLEKARDALTRLPDGPELGLLANMTDYVRNRRA